MLLMTYFSPQDLAMYVVGAKSTLNIAHFSFAASVDASFLTEASGIDSGISSSAAGELDKFNSPLSFLFFCRLMHHCCSVLRLIRGLLALLLLLSLLLVPSS